MSSVSLETRIINGWSLPHFHQWMAFSRPSSGWSYHINFMSSVSLEPEQWMCRAESSPVSLKNGIFKIIFWVQLLYQHEALSLWRTVFFKTIFLVKLLYWFEALSLRRPKNKWAFHCHLLTRTLQTQALFPGRHEQWTAISRPFFEWSYCINSKSCPPRDLNNE